MTLHEMEQDVFMDIIKLNKMKTKKKTFKGDIESEIKKWSKSDKQRLIFWANALLCSKSNGRQPYRRLPCKETIEFNDNKF